MERPWYRSVDWLLAVVCIVISGMGVLAIRSADLRNPVTTGEWNKQIGYAAVGVVLMAVFAMIDYRRWRRWTWPLYGLNVALLAGVLIGGHSSHGAVRWISLGPLGTFQPSEPAKLILAVTAATLLSRERVADLRTMIATIVVVLVPAVLILRQPDFGTMLVVFGLLSAQLFFAAERLRFFAVYAALAVGAAAFTFGTKFVLKPFQRDRLLVFLHPDADPEGIGYNLHQSKIAIGSGQVFGKGSLPRNADATAVRPGALARFHLHRRRRGVRLRRRARARRAVRDRAGAGGARDAGRARAVRILPRRRNRQWRCSGRARHRQRRG